MTLIWESCPLYSAPKAYSPPPFLSLNVWCALLLHYLPWCIHWKWPYTSVNMPLHWWWHPKSLTSTPSPTLGHHGTNELLYGFCGDYPLSLTMSANDRAGAILKWFLPLQPRTCEREGWWCGGGWKLHHPLAGGLFIHFSPSVSLLLYLKRRKEQKRSLQS